MTGGASLSDMSLITDVVIVASFDESAAIDQVNQWLLANRQSCGLAEISTGGAGGPKVASMHIYAGAFNYLDEDGFRNAVRSAPWRIAHSVIAWIDSESETYVVAAGKDETWPL